VNEATPNPTEAEEAVVPTETGEVEVEDTEAEGSDGSEFDDRDDLDWYVVHVFSGYENKAKLALGERIKSLGKADFFGEILVPEEEVTERTSAGVTRVRKKRFYPGYILVQMNLTPETWHVVKDTPKVTGFVGGNSRQPPKVPPHELATIKGKLASGTTATKPKMEFEKGETIQVVEGPFANFNGVVDEVKPEKGKLRVMVSIFGRATPVELDFLQVKKS
jgi:transcriptional antiterminator NusG